MTDTGEETTVDEVVVTGQRRKSSSASFPIRGEVPFVQYDEVPFDPDYASPEMVPDPCADPGMALPWNADAAGAGSVGEFLKAAGNLGFADTPDGVPSLGNREFGRGLARGPGQTVRGGPIEWGVPSTPGDPTSSFTMTFPGISCDEYLGDSHSHPNGNPLPSKEDWDGFVFNNNMARSMGRMEDTFYMYIFAVNPDGRTGKSYVYQDGPRTADGTDPRRPTTVGPKVNPDAQPC